MIGVILLLNGSGVHSKLRILYYILLVRLEGSSARRMGGEAQLGLAEVLEDFAIYHVFGLPP